MTRAISRLRARRAASSISGYRKFVIAIDDRSAPCARQTMFSQASLEQRSTFGGEVFGRARRIAGVRDPAAAERAVEIDEVGEALLARGDERELRVVEAGLRREHLQIAVDAVAI